MTGHAVLSPKEKITQQTLMRVLHQAPSYIDRCGGGGPSQIHMRRKSSFQVVYQKDWASVSNNKFAFDCSPNPAFAIPNILIKEMSQASSSRVGGWWVGKDAGRGHAGLLLGVGCCGGGAGVGML